MLEFVRWSFWANVISPIYGIAGSWYRFTHAVRRRWNLVLSDISACRRHTNLRPRASSTPSGTSPPIARNFAQYTIIIKIIIKQSLLNVVYYGFCIWFIWFDPIFMCNSALVFFKFFIIKATVSAPCEPCMSCRLVCLLLQSCYMYFHSTNKMDGWMSFDLISRLLFILGG